MPKAPKGLITKDVPRELIEAANKIVIKEGIPFSRALARVFQGEAGIPTFNLSPSTLRSHIGGVEKAASDFAQGIESTAGEAWRYRFFDPTRMSRVEQGELPNASWLATAPYEETIRKAGQLASGANSRARQALGLDADVAPSRIYSALSAEDVLETNKDLYQGLIGSMERGFFPNFDESVLPTELLHVRPLSSGFPHRGLSSFGDQTVFAGIPGLNAAQGILDLPVFHRAAAEARLKRGANRTLPRALEDVAYIFLSPHITPIRRQLAAARAAARKKK